MATMPRTRLELLMEMTGITGKVIAATIHVDMSLISRWKNGSRKLVNQEVLQSLAACFLKYENGDYEASIALLLRANPNERDNLEGLLIKWLAEPIKSEDGYRQVHLPSQVQAAETSTYRTYLGNAGRRACVVSLFETMLDLKKPAVLSLYSDEDMSWMIEDADFLKIWSTYLIKILKNGHEIKIVHTMNRPFNELMSAILNWVPIYLAGNIKAYHLEMPLKSFPWHTIFCIENILATSGYLYGETDQRYTMSTNDLNIVTNIGYLYNQLLSHSKALIQNMSGAQILGMWSNFTNVGMKQESSYYKSGELFFTFFEEEALKEVLKKNKVEPIAKATCIEFYRSLSGNYEKNLPHYENKHIYDLQVLNYCSMQERFEYKLLTVVTGQVIYLDREDYRALIKGAIHRLRTYDNFNIGLYLPEVTQMPLSEVDLWVKDSYFSLVWSRYRDDRLVMSFEPLMIESFDRFYHMLWEEIPFIDREKTHVIEHFEKLDKVIANQGRVS